MDLFTFDIVSGPGFRDATFEPENKVIKRRILLIKELNSKCITQTENK